MKILSVNASRDKGTVKHPIPRGQVDTCGLVGDAHAGATTRQISLLGWEAIERFSAEMGRPIGPGEFAENFTVSGLEADAVCVFDRFRTGSCEFEVTQIGKSCHGDGCTIFRSAGRCVMPAEGIFCRVVTGGEVCPGDSLDHVARLLRVRVITLSDRAWAGIYTDESGPLLASLVEEFLHTCHYRTVVEQLLLSDDPEPLRAALEACRGEGVDLIFTTGGTGIGPRDHAPEAALAFCDRLIPGVMDAIRLSHGKEHPAALLSRAVAGIAGSTLMFTLPGSVRAVNEYSREIFRVLDHAIRMARGMGHG